MSSSTISRPKTQGTTNVNVVQVHGTSEQQQKKKPELPPLNEESQAVYWQTRWQHDATNWKVAERKIGDELFANNLNGLLNRDHQQEGDDNIIKFDKFFDTEFEGIEVFVPLSGDTGILTFLFQCGFNVTGVDCSEKALRNVIEEASSKNTLQDNFTVKWEERTEGSHKIFVGTPFARNGEINEEKKLHNTLTLICGDFFTAPLPKDRFYDIVYDRASFIAIPPELRNKYAKKMNEEVVCRPEVIKNSNETESAEAKRKQENKKKLFAKLGSDLQLNFTATYFSLMQRSKESKERMQGPPFFFPIEELKKAYPEELGFTVELISFPTEEEAATTPGLFMEGKAYVYKKI